jgi:hypothetical protein
MFGKIPGLKTCGTAATFSLFDTGVFGTGGVGGVFSAGGPAGVQPGDVPPGRAGVFLAHSAAQVRLVPHKAPKRPTATQPYTVQALVSKGEETEFPANGQTGDLLCTMMLVEGLATVEVGTLWFCERGGVDKTNPAIWRQVLLGPAFSGQG